jgi:hypothetical protein
MPSLHQGVLRRGTRLGVSESEQLHFENEQAGETWEGGALASFLGIEEVTANGGAGIYSAKHIAATVSPRKNRETGFMVRGSAD